VAAWRSGHHISLRNRRPGFESRHGRRFFRENIAMLLCINDLIYIICVLKKTLSLYFDLTKIGLFLLLEKNFKRFENISFHLTNTYKMNKLMGKLGFSFLTVKQLDYRSRHFIVTTRWRYSKRLFQFGQIYLQTCESGRYLFL
jgi:hypothetical protein